VINPIDEVRQEHCALLWALSVLDADIRYRTPVYHALAGRGQAIWHSMLMRAVEIVAENVPHDRAEAAADVRARLGRLAARHSDLGADRVDDSDLGHIDAELRTLLDDGGAT
jgi:hypothetical protein